ncbi:MAG TPA: sulfotransferase [Candidatus Aquilonibacter sp.]|nr:sulfotransferase [Candidatus Aquilonibacter sp.]
MPTELRSGPLFVVGMWRSGTSLLYSLLNQHPQIGLMYEADLFLLRSLFAGKGSKRDWLGRWEFWNSALSRHDIPTDRIPEAVPDLPAAARAVWREYAGTSLVMGEKSPNYYDCLQTLSQEFPDARFLIIWRDPADICRSMVQARASASFFSKPGILHRAIIGYHKLKRECDALERRGVPLHQIQYEEMVAAPGEVMTGVCEFLGIPFDPRMTSLQGSDRSAIYEGSHHNHVKGEKIINARDRQGVLASNVARKIERYVSYWREEYKGAWPRFPQDARRDCGHPGKVERFLDEQLFRSLRILDKFTAFVYCYAPYSWLQGYRGFKSRRHRASESVVKRSALPKPSAVETRQ